MLAGIILVTVPTVMFGGLTLLHLLTRRIPGYLDNDPAGHHWEVLWMNPATVQDPAGSSATA